MAQLVAQIANRIPGPLRSRIRGLVRGAPSRSTTPSNPASPANPSTPAGPASPAGSAATPSNDLMTEADVYGAYRLFQGRAPDPEGLAFFQAHLGEWSVRQLLPYFAHSEEFRRSDTYRLLVGGVHGTEITTVDLGTHKVLVPAGDGAIGDVLVRTGTYEPHVLAALDDLISPGMTVIDCGANIGIISMHAAVLVGPTGSVIAVEALTSNATMLRLTAAANGFDHVTIHNAAASDRRGTVVIDNAAGSNGIVSGPLESLIGTVDPSSMSQLNVVGAVPLDELVADANRVDVIKLDIEGAEGLAVAGATKILERYRPAIILEYSPHLLQQVSSCSGAELLGVLTALGYSINRLGVPGERVPSTVDEIDAHLASAGLDHLDLLLLRDAS